MSSLSVLLVEAESSRAERFSAALSRSGLDAFPVSTTSEAVEALGLRPFNIVLLASQHESTPAAELLFQHTKRRPGTLLIAIHGGNDPEPRCDATVSPAVSDENIPAALVSLYNAFTDGSDRMPSNIPAFDVASFQHQLGDDVDLMKEIIGIFFEESGTQLGELREALAKDDYGKASRLAHSLKGSLGSLHAGHARYWADVLESAAKVQDGGRSKQLLASLERAIAQLQPQLDQLLRS